MIRIGRMLGNGCYQGEVVCHNCGAAAPIELWQVDPALNYAEPAGWVRIQIKGNLYGQLCPVCVTAGLPDSSKEIITP